MRRLLGLSSVLLLLPAVVYAGTCTDTSQGTFCSGTFTPGQGQIGIDRNAQAGRGRNGNNGALFVSAQDGGTGDKGPSYNYQVTGATITGSGPGIRLRTLGGNGGSGGDGWLGANPGNGGTGGKSGVATLLIDNSSITTSGKDSVGVVAISLGGTGGAGGDGIISQDAGNGGQGGDASQASITIGSGASITTSGQGAIGIFAQAVGGGGGRGGDAYVVNHGGSGAGGADGGLAYAENSGRILTTGAGATGALAQSIGGFGGNGGSGYGIATFGGDGRTAGNGSYAKVTNRGSIATRGDNALGMVAQSIGGGGGTGGKSAGIGNLGGSGGAGGNGADVLALLDGSVTTTGLQSTALLAQSIGGGGGDGGSASGFISIGGIGASGGNGGLVDIFLFENTVISTSGANSNGVQAQSIGGGGGNGGSALSAGPLVSLAIGGKGAAGGNGGRVFMGYPGDDVHSSKGTITTTGDGSTGIFLQSIGGGGGSANWTASASAGPAAGSLAIGGSGGKGGNGDTVTGRFIGQIATSGNHAAGFVEQSVGGGGGNAGLVLSAAAATSGAVSIGLGGSGGQGGTGGNVNLSTRAVGNGITTTGNFSVGILAQSAGGGGGDAGITVSGAAAGVGSLDFSLGGKGGGGGKSGAVNVFAYGTVSTLGVSSGAILAESIGGGGGNGGMAVGVGLAGGSALSLGIGGTGGGGAIAGTAVIRVEHGNISTAGANSTGVEAVSIGGGGGTGGISGALSAAPTATLGVALGGGGGTGADSAAAQVDFDGTVTTKGAWSNGIVARSVGGGGGDGGMALGLTAGGTLSANAAIGGGGNTAGYALNATVNSSGSIRTEGASANGIEASSVGGGGGSGGFAISGAFTNGAAGIAIGVGGKGAGGGDGGIVNVNNSAGITTLGAQSVGILAQSVGGGGGSGGFTGALAASTGGNIGLTFGGTGGRGGTARTVAVANSGSIFTSGANAQAILAQSVAGGGGRGGMAISGSVGTGTGASLALGGSGGAGGTASWVTVTDTAGTTYQTAGSFSDGILAQSVGGGGGAGGLAIAGTIAPSSVGAAVSLGGSGGTAGTADTVAVNLNHQTIITAGESSDGIRAQSIGGGGGEGGLSGAFTVGDAKAQVSVALGGSGGSGATASTVTVNAMSETIRTTGNLSSGISAQSIGGGGGAGGMAIAGSLPLSSSKSVSVSVGGTGGEGGRSGNVALNFGKYSDGATAGNISTTGVSAYGLVAQSIGGGGGTGGMAVSARLNLNSTAANVAVGGKGGKGNDAGKVDLVAGQGAVINTQGTNATGVLAQSIGGGGGDGGIAAAGTLSVVPGGDGIGIGVAVGGDGTDGGNASDVTVGLGTGTHNGSITTTGAGAKGIVAQSIGGGGGTGGSAFTAIASLDSVKSFNVAVGGTGGKGGNAGKVDVRNREDVTAQAGTGLLAESVGGGGGDGGLAASVGATGGDKAVQLNTTVGGNGGKGGDSKDVSVFNVGTIRAGGDLSYGLLAESIGGGGGNGGSVLSGTLGGKSSLNIGVAVGGKARDGGDAGAVSIDNYGGIYTTGKQGMGLWALSVGGGGGTGGHAGALTVTGKSSIAAGVTVGGNGGQGGIAKAVSVRNSGTVDTKGENAYAIAAQSIGGGGGFGGLAFTQTYTLGDQTGALSVSVGGNGGKGGTADTVTVSNEGGLSTFGNNAFGIFAQSIGGGGGGAFLSSATAGALGTANGGSAAFAIGGKGGAGGNGAAVAVTNDGSIGTQGDSAHGIYAQSVGGGGGSGGNAKGVAETIAAGSGKKAGYSLNLSTSIGGTGGAAGNGSTVTVTNRSTIATTGNEARGIFAQSIGGGGGSGGDLVGPGGELLKLALFINGVKKGGDSFPFAVNIGGDGGASGNGSIVTLNNTANITTKGIGSHAIEAQSIGGGGGDGGNGLTGRINVGGKGGASGNGGTVDVTNSATLSTSGERASGIFAQSIGGGGGNGGDTNTIADTSKISISSIGAYLDSLSLLTKLVNTDIGISIGGSGGASGDGGTVKVTNNGAISTKGDYANAIFAQSIGGGGGTGGAGIIMKPSQITLPGKGASAGKGADVTVVNSGALSTTGNAAMGIFAQSIGGGGGVAGSYSVGLFALADVPGWNFVNGGATNYLRTETGIVPSGSNGNGGDIVIRSTGDITTTGVGSIGILAQTAGGGGGLVGGGGSEFLGTFGNKGHGGNITLTQSGMIRATGDNGVGILLQSAGTVSGPDATGPNGKITATIGGTVIGGGGLTGAGMVISGGYKNQVTVQSTGSLSTVEPGNPYQYAFLSGSADDTLTNQGTISGRIDMGGGDNSFLNSGTFYAFGDVKVGTGNTLRNLDGGTIWAGNSTRLSSVNIAGGLVQEKGGTLVFGLHDASTPTDHRLASSTMDVTEHAIFYGGAIKFAFDPSGTMPVAGNYTINFFRAGVIYQNDASVQSTNPLINVSLDKGSRGISAKVTVDYTPDHLDLSPTQIAVGTTIASIAALQSSAVHPILHGTLFQQGIANSNFTPLPIDDALDPVELAGSPEQLMDVYQSLSPAAYAAAQAAELYAAVGFNDTLLADGSAASHRVANDNGGVAWLDFTGRRYSADFAPTRFSESGFGPSAGVKLELPSGWKVGAGVGYQSIADHMSDFSSGSGFRIMAGLTAEHDLGPLDGEIALSAGAQDLRTDRRVHAFDGALYTTAKQTSAFGTATFRLSHEFDFGDWQVRPMVDAGVAVLGMPGARETGANPLDLVVRGDTTASFRIGPAVDIKGKTTVFGLPVEPQLKVGFSDWVAGGNPKVRAGFADVPLGIPDMVSAQPDTGITADVTAGVGVDTGEGIDLRVFYTGHLNGETQIHAINFQAGYHF